MNLNRLSQVIEIGIIIIGIVLLIIASSIIASYYTNIDFTILSLFTSIVIGVIAITLAIESGWIAKKSKKRMDTIGDAEIQQSIINIQSLRKEYLYGFEEYIATPLENEEQPNIRRMYQINIFTTWLHIESIRKAIIYKDYMTAPQKTKFYRLHRTLTEIVINNWSYSVISNESILHLLSGITILYENIKGVDDFEERFYDVLNEYMYMIESDESFLEYINRMKEVINQSAEHELFAPFG